MLHIHPSALPFLNYMSAGPIKIVQTAVRCFLSAAPLSATLFPDPHDRSHLKQLLTMPDFLHFSDFFDRFPSVCHSGEMTMGEGGSLRLTADRRRDIQHVSSHRTPASKHQFKISVDAIVGIVAA